MTVTTNRPSGARWLLVLLIGAVSFASGGWLLHGADRGPALTADQLFQRVLGAVETYYVDSLPADSLMHKATKGMLDQLGDPYSVLLEGEDYRQLTEQTTGNYGGLGIQIDVRDGWITVVAPLPDTPAERVGIEAGDQIVAVEGKSTQGLNQDEAVKTLRGKPGSTVNIQVRRPGLSTLLKFAITREEIHNRSVQPGALLGDGIGLVCAQPGQRDLRGGAQERGRSAACQGHALADSRPAQEPGRPARPGRRGLRPLPRPGPADRLDPRSGRGHLQDLRGRLRTSPGPRCRWSCW